MVAKVTVQINNVFAGEISLIELNSTYPNQVVIQSFLLNLLNVNTLF